MPEEAVGPASSPQAETTSRTGATPELGPEGGGPSQEGWGLWHPVLLSLSTAGAGDTRTLSYFRHLMRRQGFWKRQRCWEQRQQENRSPNRRWRGSRKSHRLSLQAAQGGEAGHLAAPFTVPGRQR